jgi:hypothetical protein
MGSQSRAAYGVRGVAQNAGNAEILGPPKHPLARANGAGGLRLRPTGIAPAGIERPTLLGQGAQSFERCRGFQLRLLHLGVERPRGVPSELPRASCVVVGYFHCNVKMTVRSCGCVDEAKSVTTVRLATSTGLPLKSSSEHQGTAVLFTACLRLSSPMPRHAPRGAGTGGG